VVTARLTNATGWTLGALLETVRLLDEHEITALWRLPGGLSARDLDELRPSVVHLPPPDAEGELAASVETWAAEHRRKSLTFAKGPGFIRLLDRRAGHGPTFITLSSAQAGLYSYVRRRRTLGDAAASVPGVQADRVTALLARLAEHRLLIGIEEGEIQAVAIRRPPLQRWTAVG
jgi:hypothetical protein